MFSDMLIQYIQVLTETRLILSGPPEVVCTVSAGTGTARLRVDNFSMPLRSHLTENTMWWHKIEGSAC